MMSQSFFHKKHRYKILGISSNGKQVRFICMKCGGDIYMNRSLLRRLVIKGRTGEALRDIPQCPGPNSSGHNHPMFGKKCSPYCIAWTEPMTWKEPDAPTPVSGMFTVA